MEIHSSRREPDVHYGTYELAREGKLLIVHREGNKDKTGEAEIIELKARSLILVDHSNSPSGDTMRLKKSGLMIALFRLHTVGMKAWLCLLQ